MQKLIEHLYLDYPSNVLTCSDIPPTLIDTQAEEYGARTAVLEPYFAVIQAGDIQPYFNRNTDRKRLIYSVNTVKIRL